MSMRFIKENFVLVVGLVLPVLLMIAFMIFASLPQKLSDPPRYALDDRFHRLLQRQAVPARARLAVDPGVDACSGYRFVGAGGPA